MSTDNKTLADVQPGGRVRLGDGWTGWATQYPNKMPKLCGAREIAELNHYPEEGQRLIFLTENPVHVGDLVDAARAALPFVAFAYSKGVAGAEEAGRAIEAALSAQPSPGGQDARELLADEYDAAGSDKRATLIREGRDHAPSTSYALRAIEAALAARQPVGEPVCNVEGTWLWSKLMDWCKRMGAAPSNHDELFAIAKEANALYTAPPAQAVDLGEVREAVRKAWQKCADGGSVDLQFGTLLALIDSQAVGK